MSEYVYRIVDAETGEPPKRYFMSKRQHTYTKSNVARSVCTSMNNEEDWRFSKFSPPERPKRTFKVQRSATNWEDLP